jgi:hypothetical protein
MGLPLSICTKRKSLYDSLEVQSLYTHKDEESLLSKFTDLSNNPLFLSLESSLGPFQFTYNYYLDLESTRLSKVPVDFEALAITKSHTVASPLIGRDSEGTWVYIGECLLGSTTKDGRGFMVHLDKQYKFQGYFRAGSRNGRGRLTTAEKLPEGEWFNDELVGEAKEVTKDRCVYVGKFAGGLYDSMGKMTYADGGQYCGEFVKGERQGQGEYLWADGSKFVGRWEANMFHGIGKYVDVQGNNYEGGWRENQMDGYGEYEWRDGKKYRGNYYNGKKHGYGEMEWPDGNQWRGSWKKGLQHGRGEFVCQGVKKSGNWYEGKFITWIE